MYIKRSFSSSSAPPPLPVFLLKSIYYFPSFLHQKGTGQGERVKGGEGEAGLSRSRQHARARGYSPLKGTGAPWGSGSC